MSADLAWWSPPVPVKTPKIGTIHNVASAAAGLDQLREWKRLDHPKCQIAFQLCVAAMGGKATPEEARKAFVAAAKATGNLMGKV